VVTQKSITPEQRALAAEAFDADGHALSATKRLVDVKHPAFRAVTAVRTRATDYWRGTTLPYPEPGIRLIKREKLEEFAAAMADYRAELEDAFAELDRHYGELVGAARERLGRLFHPEDYPESLAGLFGVQYDFPNVEPPGYLMQLSPGLYEQERARVAARFEEAVRLAEAAFTEEFARLVEHLGERITGVGEDGQPKVFRDSAVDNLVGFFARFRELNVRSNEQLDELIGRAQRAVRGVGAPDLRDSQPLRERVAGQLAQVRTALDSMMVERPRRRILRQSQPAGGG
jgi:hypothetical protein